ncbi:MAG: DUF1178 family protein [Filomicrobium sp.]
MIKYTLHCEEGHEFEAWFGGNQDYENQKSRALLSCPVCTSTKVEKSLMAPNVITRKGKTPTLPTEANEAAAASPAPSTPPQATHVPAALASSAAQKALVNAVRELRSHIEANTEDVGKDFAEEARKIHYRETDARGIRGEATPSEVKDLEEEGIEIAMLPKLPDEHN